MPKAHTGDSKRCTGCGLVKPLSEFWKRKDRPGPMPKCIACCHLEAVKAHQRRKLERNNPPVEEKQCGKCQLIKPASSFYPDPIASDGLGYECRDCRKQRAIDYRKRVGYKRPLPPPDGMKRCGRCKVVKQVSAFHKNAARHDGLDGICRECVKLPQMNNYLQHKYGISLEQYNTLLDTQDGVCAICRKPETVIHLGKTPRLAVDEDPIKKANGLKSARGLLCEACNRSLRGLEHFILSNTLHSAISYLESHGVNQS